MSTKCATVTLAEAIRYLDYLPEFSHNPGGNTPLSGDPNAPDSEGEAETRREFQAKLTALLNNSAQAANKLGGTDNLRTAISLADRSIGISDPNSSRDRGRLSQSDTEISDDDNHLSQGILQSGAGAHRSQGRS